jgi:hypothetical protein
MFFVAIRKKKRKRSLTVQVPPHITALASGDWEKKKLTAREFESMIRGS